MQALRNIAGKKSIITKSQAGNEGKIVTCLRLATEEEKKELGRAWNPDALWIIDVKVNTVLRMYGKQSVQQYCAFDASMTPLQDLDESEQQVQELFAPSPKKETLVLKIDTTQLQKQLKEMLEDLQ